MEYLSGYRVKNKKYIYKGKVHKAANKEELRRRLGLKYTEMDLMKRVYK